MRHLSPHRVIVDAHIHFDSPEAYPRLQEDLRREGADQCCVLVIDHYPGSPYGFRQAEGIWLKQQHPSSVFLFGGVDWTLVLNQPPAAAAKAELLLQLNRLRDLGFDGLKLLTGKPNIRKALAHPLDGPVFAPMYDWLEETGFPVLWHVGDPAEFWSAETVPLWARQNQWWYDDTHPPKAVIDREIAAVLTRHPRLNLILPHFFFLSGALGEAEKFLLRHPNISLDLAPGVEWMHHLSKDPQAGRAFLTRFADRIIFGSDMGIMHHSTHAERGPAIRRFLETAGEFPVPPDPFMSPSDEPPLRGLALPEDALARIYAKNFHRLVGRTTPRPLDEAGIAAYLQELGHPL